METVLPRSISQGLSKISVVLRAREQQGATEEQLSPTQGLILARLHSFGPLRLSRLAEDLAISLPTVSDAVNTLARKQLIDKRQAEDDARAQRVHLTAQGATVAARTALWPDLLAHAAGTLSQEQQRVFHLALIQMIRSLQDQGAIPMARMCVNCRFFRQSVHRSKHKPHHCDYVDAPLGDTLLQIDCGEFQPCH